MSTNLDLPFLHVLALLPAANFVDAIISSSANLAAIVLGLALGHVHLPEGSTEEAEVTSGVPQSLNSGTQHGEQQPCKHNFSESPSHSNLPQL